MEKLSVEKQLSMIKMYLSGLPYDEISAKAGVSKGSVSNLVADLKAGRILDAQEPVEQLELLRELAIDLRRLKLTPGQAVTGTAIVSRLQELSIEPGDIEHWAVMCRHLAPQGTEAPAFVRVALALEEVTGRTGLNVEALEDKVRGLEQEAARLEPLVQELQSHQRELEKLEKRRQSLAVEVGQLEERLEPLRRSVTQKEQREGELSQRVGQLEERAQASDERLVTARRELQALAGLGLSPKELTGLVQRMGGIAQRHGFDPGKLRERLIQELETLEAGLALEPRLEIKRRELKEVERAVSKARQKREALDLALQQLRQQQATLSKSIAEEQAHVHKEIQAIARIAGDAVAKLRQDLAKGAGEAILEVQNLRDQALELGQQLGRFEATIQANEWLRNLLSLVKGDGNVSASQVRAVGLSVLRGLQGWLGRNNKDTQLPYGLRTRVEAAIQELEQWKA